MICIKAQTAAGLAVLLATLALQGCGPARPAPVTIAITGTSAEPAPSAAGVLKLLTEHATGAVFPGDGLVRLVAQGHPARNIDLTPMRKDEVENKVEKAHELVSAHVAALTSTMADSGAATPGLDLIGTLDQALEVTPRGGTIVVISSGLSTLAPLDLNKAGDWSLRPAQVARAINAGDLPSAEGRDLVFAGLGYGAGLQPSAGPAARRALIVLWTTVCKRMGANSCRVLPGPSGSDTPVSTNRVPVIRFDKVTTACVGTIEVSADVAFASDSAVLSLAADSLLAPIARSLGKCEAGRTLNAIGHYAEVPGGGDGRALSKARAVAVLERLKALGAPTRVLGTAIGCGGAVPCQLVDNTPAGVYDEALAKKNRVVELTVRTR